MQRLLAGKNDADLATAGGGPVASSTKKFSGALVDGKSKKFNGAPVASASKNPVALQWLAHPKNQFCMRNKLYY